MNGKHQNNKVMSQLKTRTYFGEYTLKHWIELLIKGNLILPDYQRSFVWSSEKVKKLIEDIKTGQFIPPVIIGAYKDSNQKNMIIDGQQRLTSVLLFYLNVYPQPQESSNNNTFSEAEDENEDENENFKPFSWTMRDITSLGNNKEEIEGKITESEYKKLYDNFDINEVNNLLENSFIGFSYIVPDEDDESKQSKFYSTVFRSINYLGNALSAQESRKSLYFLDKKYTNFFDTDALSSCMITQNSIKKNVDVIRYFSMLSQYKKEKKVDKIAYGYGTLSKRENYYEKYINEIVTGKESSKFEKFDVIFPDGNYEESLNKLKEIVIRLPETNFSSIIDADFFLFGLIYFVVFEHKTIRLDSVLIESIQEKIRSIKERKANAKYRHAPNALKNIRDRMKTSISIYKKYAN